jgi:hypothetical protein
MRPSPKADGCDAPRLGFKFAPSVATVGDDIFVVFEDAVREPVVAHELPEVFDGIEFRAARGERQEGDVVGNGECTCCMPASLIEDQNAMGIRADCGGDDFQMLCHGMAIGPRHDQTSSLAVVWADSTKQPHRSCALIFGGAGPRSPLGPSSGQLCLLPYAGFVLEPDFEGLLAHFFSDLLERAGEVFLKAMAASMSWPG